MNMVKLLAFIMVQLNMPKEMIDLGFKLVTISSDFRSMSAHAQSVIDEMKDKTKEASKNEAY